MTSVLEGIDAPADWAERAPGSPTAWLRRAEEVRAILAETAVERDRANRTPFAEVRLLKDSGLVTLLGPVEFGGGGQRWRTAFQVVRTISRGDGSIGQLLGYHYLWAWAVRLVGTEAQIAAVERLYTENRFVFGGAVNPRDGDLTITEDGDELVYNGRKSFSTGGRVSDLTVLEGVLDGTETHVFAIVPTEQPGLRFQGDWDNLGQRLTESGSVVIDNVRAPWASAAGFENRVFQPLVYNTLNVPLIQQLFSNIYLGIAQGAIERAAEYTRTLTRPWPYGGESRERATDEWYLQAGYGELQARLWADEAFIDEVDARLADVLHADRRALTERARGELAVRVAAAKVRIVEDGLEVASRVFELTGARASANSVGLDVHWRNLRTHSLHDPLPYKKKEVGEYVLLGRVPDPSWYT